MFGDMTAVLANLTQLREELEKNTKEMERLHQKFTEAVTTIENAMTTLQKEIDRALNRPDSRS